MAGFFSWMKYKRCSLIQAQPKWKCWQRKQKPHWNNKRSRKMCELRRSIKLQVVFRRVRLFNSQVISVCFHSVYIRNGKTVTCGTVNIWQFFFTTICVLFFSSSSRKCQIETKYDFEKCQCFGKQHTLNKIK